ncbi:altronate hydrolase [Spirosomataceae bacterium TFI 002]|nr:altronate hydrolase [Spirosomataceae bacterium TFI 002]
MQQQSVLKVQASDNVLVALTDLSKGTKITYQGQEIVLTEDISAKHKIAGQDFAMGDEVFMYGVLVGKVSQPILKGGWINVFNLKHASQGFSLGDRKLDWEKPSISNFENRTFNGFHRKDGSVGTANYWIVIPLVFCENRNLEVMKKALIEDLGYGKVEKYQSLTKSLLAGLASGKSSEELLATELKANDSETGQKRVFENIDGIKFLSHEMGCGGTRQDAQALCGLLAGYITNPNVAGATVLSLGCQNAQISLLQEELAKRNFNDSKPVHFLEQQKEGTEEALVSKAIKLTFTSLIEANKITRKPASLTHLNLGLECGGSDGFSGISANPTVGYTSDLLVSLGASVVLSEFPELCGVEQELSDRCETAEIATRFNELMTVYSKRAVEAGSGFDMNPSPGNIKDGLITDAIKSAGAAKKGGTSPVTDVLDYPEKVTKKGLNLLCTPGNDVESTTAMIGSGCNIAVFTTGLGTPTGNPIAPVVKIASNTILAQKMSDIIDVDTGSIIRGEESIEQAGERLLEFIISVASGDTIAKAVLNDQDDFIPWKRGVSL